MGYRTVYDQPSQLQYIPNRFSTYAGVHYNPTGGFKEFGDDYLTGFKQGDLESYALPVGIGIALLPTLMPKSFKKKKVKQAVQLGGLAMALYSLGKAYYDSHMKAPAT